MLSISKSAIQADLYTVAEIARKGKVSQKSVRRWINRSELKIHRLGSQIRISEVDWQTFLNERRQP